MPLLLKFSAFLIFSCLIQKFLGALDIDSKSNVDPNKATTNENTSQNKIEVGLNNNYDDDDFTMLITGGYRPDTDVIFRPLVSIRRGRRRIMIGDNHICGGSIIHPKAVLTAAHCVMDGESKASSSDFEIFVGSPNRFLTGPPAQILKVAKVVKHKRYSALTMKCDIAILKLKNAIVIDNKTTELMKLPTFGLSSGTKCYVIGWGRLFHNGPSPSVALAVNIEIMPTHMCRRESEVFKAGSICAKDPSDNEKDSCSGDSGGPLICDGVIAGIVSYGYGCASGRPGYYTDVFYYKDWINENNSPKLLSSVLMNVLCFGIAVIIIIT